MGAFTFVFAKIFKIYPIPIKMEITGGLIALGVAWLIRQINGEFYSLSFEEQARLVLLGYLPMRIMRWPKRKKDE